MLPSCSKELLNEWLCVYITETRNHNGEKYPPKTLYSLLSGILREMRAKNPGYPNFLKKDDPDFSKFQDTLDKLFKMLQSDGIGSDFSLTEGITLEEAGHLLRAAFFTCGKCFCPCAGQEHCNLALSQLQRKQNPERYIYTERINREVSSK